MSLLDLTDTTGTNTVVSTCEADRRNTVSDKDQEFLASLAKRDKEIMRDRDRRVLATYLLDMISMWCQYHSSVHSLIFMFARHNVRFVDIKDEDAVARLERHRLQEQDLHRQLAS